MIALILELLVAGERQIVLLDIAVLRLCRPQFLLRFKPSKAPALSLRWLPTQWLYRRSPTADFSVAAVADAAVTFRKTKMKRKSKEDAYA